MEPNEDVTLVDDKQLEQAKTLEEKRQAIRQKYPHLQEGMNTTGQKTYSK
jgi:hypothetical protein